MIICNKPFINYVPFFTSLGFSYYYLFSFLVQRLGGYKNCTLICLQLKQAWVKQCGIAKWKVLVDVQGL